MDCDRMTRNRLPRKIKKRLSLRRRQLDILTAKYKDDPDFEAIVMNEASWESPLETIRQSQHERWVFGHSDEECTCTPWQVEVAVAWNQPPESWIGREAASEYHRRRR